MLRLSLTLAFGLVPCFGSTRAADQPTKLDPKAAESKLRKVQEAVKHADLTLRVLSQALYAGSVLTGNPDLNELSRLTDDLRKAASELHKHADRIVELAEKQKDGAAAEKEGRTVLEKVKLLRIKNQAEELDRLARKVRELPVGLVSHTTDNKFAVSADLLAKDPREAQARFRAYLTAMKTNAEYLKEKQEQLEEAGRAAKAAGQFLAGVQSDIEKAIPFCGLYAKPLTELYLDVDDLAGAYNGLAAACTAKAKGAKRIAEVERRRHDNLRASLWTVFGFRP